MNQRLFIIENEESPVAFEARKPGENPYPAEIQW